MNGPGVAGLEDVEGEAFGRQVIAAMRVAPWANLANAINIVVLTFYLFWVLHESTEDANVWVNFASSDLDFPTWVEAYDSGTVELMRLVIDERTGPRAPGKTKTRR